MGAPWFFDLVVEATSDQPEDVERRFKAISAPRPCREVEDEGPWRVFGVTDGTRVEARSFVVEDSGDGEAILVVGGLHGLLLVQGGRERREPYLLLARSTPVA